MIHIGVLIIVLPPAQPEEKQPIRVVPQPVDTAEAIREAIRQPEPPAYVARRGEVVMRCPKCHWWAAYQDKSTARRGIAGHRNWCNRSK